MGAMVMTMGTVMVTDMTTMIIVMMDIPDLITGAIVMAAGVDQGTDLNIGGKIKG
jgi:hypothetical protein